MRILAFPLFLFAAFLSQALLTRFVSPEVLAADFVLATVAVLGVTARPAPALAAAAAGGLLQDAVSSGYVGLNGLSKLLVCHALQRFSESWPAIPPLAFLPVSVFAALADGVLLIIVRAVTGGDPALAGTVAPFLLGIPVTALYAVLLHMICRRIRAVSRYSVPGEAGSTLW